MELTLSVLVRVRALFDGGASVEEVYETLGVADIPARDDGGALLARVRAGLDETTDLAALSRDVAHLAELIERLREDVQSGVVMPFPQVQAQQPQAQKAGIQQTEAQQTGTQPTPPPAPPQQPIVQPTADKAPAEQPSPQADTTPRPPAPPVEPVATPAAASHNTPVQKAPNPKPQNTGNADPYPVDLRDQLAVAVTRISMLMGQDGSRLGEDDKVRPRRAG